MNTSCAKETLPDGYAAVETVNLVKNRKQLLIVNGLAVVLAAALVLLGVLIRPQAFHELFSFGQNGLQTACKWLIIGVGSFAYIIGHEAVHGLLMWRFSHIRPSFGFSLAYAYAGSSCYFAKGAYLLIAIAPVTVWFVLLGITALLAPSGWFWVIWLIQVINLGGAAGDFFVFARVLRQPKTLLVQDTGTSMMFFLPQE